MRGEKRERERNIETTSILLFACTSFAPAPPPLSTTPAGRARSSLLALLLVVRERLDRQSSKEKPSVRSHERN